MAINSKPSFQTVFYKPRGDVKVNMSNLYKAFHPIIQQNKIIEDKEFPILSLKLDQNSGQCTCTLAAQVKNLSSTGYHCYCSLMEQVLSCSHCDRLFDGILENVGNKSDAQVGYFIHLLLCINLFLSHRRNSLALWQSSMHQRYILALCKMAPNNNKHKH